MTTGDAPPSDAPPAPPSTDGTDRAPATTRRRFDATAADLVRLVIGSIGAAVIAIGFLFWRTSWGAVDATTFDTAIAAALLLTPAPTWLAWMLASALEDRATPGQQRRRIGVRFTNGDWTGVRLLRFAIHPLSLPGWLWSAAIMSLLNAPILSLVFVIMAALVAVTGLLSLLLLVIGRRPFHDVVLHSEVEALG